MNRNGKWRALERIEEDALRAGKHVISKRKLLYKGKSKCPYGLDLERIEEDDLLAGKDVFYKINLLYKGKSKCPYAIEFTYIIDGKKTSVLVKNS